MVRQGRAARVRVAARPAAEPPAQDARPGRAGRALRTAPVLPEDAWVDWEVAPERVRAARAALDNGGAQHAWEAAREAVEIAERGLLPGLEAPWIDSRRSELADLRVEALEALAIAGIRLGGAAWPDAEQAARAAVQAQPYRESARVALMEVLRARGNVNEALRVYEDIRVLLREELGSTPGARLVALHEQLLRDEPGAPSPSRSRGRRRAAWSSATARWRCSTPCSPRRAWARAARS